jgi:acyl-CoA thioesterase
MGDSNQAEHKQISTALEVEKVGTNLFRSKSLWVPARGRGVFGGQVISQSLVSGESFFLSCGARLIYLCCSY